MIRDRLIIVKGLYVSSVRFPGHVGDGEVTCYLRLHVRSFSYSQISLVAYEHAPELPRY